MEDAAAPPAAPVPPAAPATPAAPEAPAPATGDAPSSAPTPGEQRASRLRFQGKVAGVMMMLFGAFFALQFGLAAYNNPQLTERYAAYPGGNFTVDFPQAAGASVTLVYRSGAPETHGRLDAAGHGAFEATNATFTLQVTHAGGTWTRQAFVPLGTPPEMAAVTLDASSPQDSTERVGLPTDFAWLWPATVAAVLVAAGGYFAFKLRGPRLALGGAFLFLLGAGLFLSLFGLSLLPISLLGTSALSFFFVYRARSEFLPFRPARA